MTIEYLVNRDVLKTEANLARAKAKPNVPKEELEQLEELLKLRKQIAEMIMNERSESENSSK